MNLKAKIEKKRLEGQKYRDIGLLVRASFKEVKKKSLDKKERTTD